LPTEQVITFRPSAAGGGRILLEILGGATNYGRRSIEPVAKAVEAVKKFEEADHSKQDSRTTKDKYEAATFPRRNIFIRRSGTVLAVLQILCAKQT
jgi:hypothetical protein